MARKKSSVGLSRSEVAAATRNLVKKGLIVARTDINGKIVYFIPECAPPPGPFELESYRHMVEEKERRSKLRVAAPRIRR